MHSKLTVGNGKVLVSINEGMPPVVDVYDLMEDMRLPLETGYCRMHQISLSDLVDRSLCWTPVKSSASYSTRMVERSISLQLQGARGK